jgi:carbon monoxide dehydrogenase subunit G
VKLEHRFVVPAPVEQTWAAFNDLERVVPCFPGATLTGYEGDDFTGSCKVKLGPVSLQYSGTGSFVERDEYDHHAVIEAKGKDRRGNGTATARVTARLAGISEGSTEVTVDTDLTITGRPAQFGRGLIQDVSNKLLDQFTTCLKSKLNQPTSATEAGGGGAQPAAAGNSADAAGSAGAAGGVGGGGAAGSDSTQAVGATGQPDGAMGRSASGDSREQSPNAERENSPGTAGREPAGTAGADTAGTGRENSTGTAHRESAGVARGESSGMGRGQSTGTARGESTGTARGESAGTAHSGSEGTARAESAGTGREESAEAEAVALDLGSTLLPMLAKRAAPYLIGAALALVLRRLFRR